MSSTFENGEKKEEVTPEALLERLEKAMSSAETSKGSLFDLFKLVDDLSGLMLRTISKSRANADTKAQATLYLGVLISKLNTLLKAYRSALDHDLAYTDELHGETENDLKKFIEAYAYLKNGGSLEKAIGIISDAQLSAQRRIKEFLYYLAKDIYSLSRPDPWSYW